jgi:hypothetical protein
LLDGADIWSSTEIERTAFRCRYIGFVFQFPRLRSNLMVDNVAVPTVLGRTWSQRSRMRAHHLLVRIDLCQRDQRRSGHDVCERAERMARLADMALCGPQSEIQAVADLGQLAVYLLNASDEPPTLSLRKKKFSGKPPVRIKAWERRTSFIIAGQ